MEPKTPLSGWDSHCHLQLDPLYADWKQVLFEANRFGVRGCIVPAYSPKEWDRQTVLGTDSRIRNALGIHPWALSDLDPELVLATLDEAFRHFPTNWAQNLVAVGEFGLDRARTGLSQLFELQRAVFARHMYWASQLQLPVIVHSVQAIKSTLELLRVHQVARGGVLHSYSGPPEMIPDFAEVGMRFSYSGSLLTSERARNSLKATPAELLLWETDGPRVSPGSSDSAKSGPQDLPQIVEFASQILGKSIEWCWSVHNENMADLFHFQETT